MLSSTAHDDRAIRALETYVRLLDRKARLFGADLPVCRFVEVEVITDELLRSERERLDAQLTAMGVDVSQLPSPDEMAAILEERMRASRLTPEQSELPAPAASLPTLMAGDPCDRCSRDATRAARRCRGHAASTPGARRDR
jgi:hypothetical protein